MAQALARDYSLPSVPPEPAIRRDVACDSRPTSELALPQRRAARCSGVCRERELPTGGNQRENVDCSGRAGVVYGGLATAGRGGPGCEDRHGEHHVPPERGHGDRAGAHQDRKSTRLNSSHVKISYAVFCLKKKKKKKSSN